MRSINYAIKGAMLGGMVLVLSTSPALAFGANKVLDEKPKVEINKVEIKVEKNKVEKAMLEENKAGDYGVLRNDRVGIRRINLLGEDILGEEGILEGILGEGLLGIEE
jgi:hypothetical protein